MLSESNVQAAAELVGGERGMRLFNAALKMVVGPLQKYELNALVVKTRELASLK